MSQHDQVIANDAGAAVRADINAALAALFGNSSGASAPSTTIAYQWWADTTSGLLKQRNAANTGWLVRGTLAESFVISRASNTILAASDYSKAFVATSTFTQTLTAAATLGDGWFARYRVNSGATVTFDPNSSENIDGATTKVVVGPSAGVIFCNGSAFFTYGFDDPAASDTVAGLIEIAVQSEMEAGTDTTRAVVPGRQHYHPSAAKAWVDFTGTGTVTNNASYNVSSITDNGTGDYTVNLTTAFSSANYATVASAGNNGAAGTGAVVLAPQGAARTTSAVRLSVRNSSFSVADGDRVGVACFGDL